MEPDISPLAKRLAEENNVSWQSLAGSGTGGRIVERDVLEYLAKVMSGEEDVNPTPEPLPAGMEAWPEQDVAAYFGGDETEQGVSTQGVSASGAAASGADDDLMLDMDGLDMGGPGVDSPGVDSRSMNTHGVDSRGAPAPEGDLDDDIFLFEEEPERREDFGAAFGRGADASGTGLEDALADDPLTAGDLADDTLADDTLVDDAFADDTLVDDAFADDTSSDPAGVDFSGAFASSVAAPDALEPEDAEDMSLFLAADAPQETEEDVPLFGVAQDAPEPEPGRMAFEVDSLADGSLDEPYGTRADLEPDLQVAPIASGRAPNELALGALPLVRFGVLLRRYADLGPLFEAQSAIGQELNDQSVPLPSLLARAAARALGTAPLGEGSGVGVARIADGGLRVMAFQDAATQSFRDLLAATGEALELGDLPGRVALVVADLSDFDVDEAVLNVGVPVLTLGRILYDSESGGHRSTLALSGDLGLEEGTAFLTRVAELLRSPVRLVV